MHQDRKQRRYPRLPLTCSVEVRDRLMVWTAQTADVGLRGCQVLTPRVPKVGELLRLSLASERVRAPLDVLGQVVWARSGAAPRAGISYLGPTPRVITASPAHWFERLLDAEIEAATRPGGDLAALDVKVFLGTPPSADSLTEEEREVASDVAKGALLSQLLTDPALGKAATSLLRRGHLTLLPGSATTPSRWEDALAHGISARGGRLSGGYSKPPPPGFEGVAAELQAPALPPAARELLEGFVAAFMAGDGPRAAQVLRRAFGWAPGDPAMTSILERIRQQRAVPCAGP